MIVWENFSHEQRELMISLVSPWEVKVFAMDKFDLNVLELFGFIEVEVGVDTNKVMIKMAPFGQAMMKYDVAPRN